MVVPGYQLVRRLSLGGGPTEVWSARTSIGGEAVALKILRQCASEDQRLRFAAERALLGRLGGRHGVIRQLGTVDAPPAIVLELMPGGNLRTRIGEAPVSQPDAIRLGIDTARTLQWLHERQVIHRDVKSSNVLLALDGSSRLADFSVAAEGDPPRSLPDGWIEETVGTLGYAAPELLRAPNTATPMMDVYGLGAVLYEMLTGRLPAMMEGDEDELQLRARVAAGAQAPPLRPGVDSAPWLAAVVMRALDPNPATRFQAARDVEAALRNGSSAV